MKAFVGTSLGSLDRFSITDVPLPVPGNGEVRIRVQATALGFVDGLLVEGRYQIRPEVPYIPGGEIAGIVDAVGPGVDAVEPGQRVVTWQLGGGLAEQVVVRAVDVDVVEDGIDPVDAAAVLIDYQTAHHALFGVAQLRADEVVLVLGAAGGVGSAAVQMASRAGATVIAAASTDEKRRRALALGAAQAIDHTAPDWRASLKAASPRRSVDVVFDPLGGSTFEPAFRSLAKDGRHLVVGFASGSIPSLPVNLALLKNASLRGVELRHLVARDPAYAKRVRREIFSQLRSGALQAPALVRFPLDEAGDALRTTRDRSRIGKVVVLPGLTGRQAG